MAADLEGGLVVGVQTRPDPALALAVQIRPVAALGCTVVVNSRPAAVVALSVVALLEIVQHNQRC